MAGVDSFSVVICAYADERWNDLRGAVASVEDQTMPPFEIIVVIDHNPALLRRAQQELPGVRALENCGERGLSGARNTGVSAAHGQAVAFLDDDAVADGDWLANLSAAYEHDRVLGVGGAIVPLWEQRRPRWFPQEFDWVVGCTYRGMPEKRAKVRNLIGANMSFRREVLEASGHFRDGIGRVGAVPLGCEETELCIRARQLHPEGEFVYEPGAVVHHRVPASRARWGYFRARARAEGLSKAAVSRLVGAGDGLSSERSYTLRTLPAGVLAGLRHAIFGRDISGLARAGAIVSGLAITSFGYVSGTLRGAAK